MELSDFIIEKTKKVLSDGLQEKYDKTMSFFTEVSFDDFLFERIIEVQKEVES